MTTVKIRLEDKDVLFLTIKAEEYTMYESQIDS